MCSDTDTCRQLRDFLQTMHIKPRAKGKSVAVEGDEDEEDMYKPSARFLMRRKLRNYLRWKRQFAQVNAALFSENQKALNNAIDPRLQGAHRNRWHGGEVRRAGGGCGGGWGKRMRRHNTELFWVALAWTNSE